MIRIAVDGPFDWPAMLAYFEPRAIRGVERPTADAYQRVVADGRRLVVRMAGGRIVANLPDRRRVQRLLGLDAAHDAAVDALRRDRLVGRRIRSRPGMRVPGTWDPFETGVRAIAGQQVSVAGASTVTARVVARHGIAAGDGEPGLSHAFPSPAVLAEADLDGLGLTDARVGAIRGWSAAVASGSVTLDGTVPLDEFVESVVALRGLGPWTAHYVALRIGYSDAFPVADLGLQRAAGLDGRSLGTIAQRWQPFRALAAVHLWETPG